MSTRSVVVTGGTRGIGQGLARELLKRGCQVTITGTSDASIAKGLEALGGAGPNLIGVAADVADRDAMQGVWDKAVAAFGRVDIWINNAGISLSPKPIHLQPAEDIQRIVDINLIGVFNGDAVAIKGMLAQGSGYIWNMEGYGSDGMTQRGLSPYGSTKRAVTYVTNSLIKELKDSPVGIGHLSPGIVVTDLLVADYADAPPERWEKVKKTFNILGDTVETVTPYLADGVLNTDKHGERVAWLTKGKAARRFLTAGFNKRDLFADIDPTKGNAGSRQGV